MPYIRISLTEPKPEHIEETRGVHRELLRFDKTLPGFIDGYFAEDMESAHRMGRVTFWEGKADADHAAQQQHTLTLRAQLLRLIVDDAAGINAGLEATRI